MCVRVERSGCVKSARCVRQLTLCGQPLIVLLLPVTHPESQRGVLIGGDTPDGTGSTHTEAVLLC